METGNWAERTHSKAVAGAPGWARQRWMEQADHICMWINWEEQLGRETDHITQGSSVGK